MHNSSGVVSAMSQAIDARQAAEELAEQLPHPYRGRAVFLLTSDDLQALGQALQQCFGSVRGWWAAPVPARSRPKAMGRNCVTAMGFNHAHFSIATELIDQVEHQPGSTPSRWSNVSSAAVAATFCADQGQYLRPDLCLMVSFSREQSVPPSVPRLDDYLLHFGGSAGDDNFLTHTHVLNGAFHSGAAWCWSIPAGFSRSSPLTTSSPQRKAGGDRRRQPVAPPELNAEPAAEEYARHWSAWPWPTLTTVSSLPTRWRCGP